MYKRILDLREEKNYTQKQVADMIKCSQSNYSKFENGKQDVPTQTLIMLTKIYNVSSDYILGLTDEKQPYPRGK